MPHLRPATELTPAELAGLFGRSYEGYFVPIRVDPPAFERMVSAWNLDLAASRVLFEDGAPAGLAMLGRRGRRGWIGGMGVVPERRGSGWGRVLMEAVIQEAWRGDLTRVDLEVLEQNAPAIRIYERLGFRDLRSLEVWTRPAAPLEGTGELPAAAALDVSEALAVHPTLHAERAPWQRDLPALESMRPRLRATGVRKAGRIEAYVICRFEGGHLGIEDLGLAAHAHEAAIESALHETLRGAPEAAATLVNLPAGDRAGPVLERLGFRVTLRQREMSLVP